VRRDRKFDTWPLVEGGHCRCARRARSHRRAATRGRSWKAGIAAARDALDPIAAQLGDILTAARSQADRLKKELTG
jgi:hypothetical protein